MKYLTKILSGLLLAVMIAFSGFHSVAKADVSDAFCQNKWSGTRLDDQTTEVFNWVAPFWQEIINDETINNNFKEVSNNYNTVVIDQAPEPLFLTEDGAYLNGKRFAVGDFEFSKHKTWSGQRPSGEELTYRFNETTGFWEEVNKGIVIKTNFKEVENNKTTVTIDQGVKKLYLTSDGAYYDGTKFASGSFSVPPCNR